MFEGFTTYYLRQEKGTAIARPKRFFVSGPILIGTAIGAASIATAGVTAHYVAKAETNRIVEEEQIHRIEDVENGIHNNQVNLNIYVEMRRILTILGIHQHFPLTPSTPFLTLTKRTMKSITCSPEPQPLNSRIRQQRNGLQQLKK